MRAWRRFASSLARSSPKREGPKAAAGGACLPSRRFRLSHPLFETLDVAASLCEYVRRTKTRGGVAHGSVCHFVRVHPRRHGGEQDPRLGQRRFQTIPVPTSITAGCGIALKFDADDPEPVLARVFGANRDTGLAALHREVAPRSYETVCTL